MEHETLASELLHEVKASAKRWFIIALAELAVIVVLVMMLFFIPVEEYNVDQEAHDSENTSVSLIGGNYYGEDQSELQEETWSGQAP